MVFENTILVSFGKLLLLLLFEFSVFCDVRVTRESNIVFVFLLFSLFFFFKKELSKMVTVAYLVYIF